MRRAQEKFDSLSREKLLFQCDGVSVKNPGRGLQEKPVTPSSVIPYELKQILILISLILFQIQPASAADQESICYGTAFKGRLENGVQLPEDGANFKSYSNLGSALGRTWVHSSVRDVVITTYKNLESSAPGKKYMYGETGKKNGGSFKPHKTHQNGLSVDFMVPVFDEKGQSIFLPISIFNKFGYGIEFDEKGRYGKYRIDYEAMSAHIYELHREAVRSGIGIRIVIFDPVLQAGLFNTRHGDYLKKNLSFSGKRSWVRHDEHYHVEVIVPCEPF